MNTDSGYAVSSKTKLSDEDYTIGVDFTPMLGASETILAIVSCALFPVAPSADPTIVAATDTALVIVNGSPTPNAAPFPDDSQPPVNVATAKGILFEVQGGTPPTLDQKTAGVRFTRYDIKLVFQTSLSPKRAGIVTVLVPA